MSAEPHAGSCQRGAVAFEAVVDIPEPATCPEDVDPRGLAARHVDGRSF